MAVQQTPVRDLRATAQNTVEQAKPHAPRVFMMDLLATVPYYTAYLTRALRELGVPVQLGTISYYLDPECFRSRGLRPQPGVLDVVGKFPRLPRVLRQALKLVETAINLCGLTLRFLFRPPEIVHIQYLPMLRLPLPLDAWFARFCRWRGARLLLTVHDLLPHDTAERYHALFTKLYAGMDALICHSDHVRERLIKEFFVPAEKIEVIPHGPFFFDLPVDDAALTRRRLRLEPDAPLVLWQGIIFPYKGLDVLLEAWQQAEREEPRAELLVLGTGSATLTEALQNQAKTLGLQRVHMEFRFCSAEELVAAYRAADVVVYPYRAITTSGALATGLALGKAIVASDLPVFRELLEDGRNARLVAPADPAQLASALVTLVQNRTERERLASAVRDMQFGTESWCGIAKTTAELYRKISDNDTPPEFHA